MFRKLKWVALWIFHAPMIGWLDLRIWVERRKLVRALGERELRRRR